MTKTFIYGAIAVIVVFAVILLGLYLNNPSALKSMTYGSDPFHVQGCGDAYNKCRSRNGELIEGNEIACKTALDLCLKGISTPPKPAPTSALMPSFDVCTFNYGECTKAAKWSLEKSVALQKCQSDLGTCYINQQVGITVTPFPTPILTP